MADKFSENLLSQFYGFNNKNKEEKVLSSSEGVENYQTTQDIENLSTEYLISCEDLGDHQNTEEESENVHQENACSLPKSPHVLSIDELKREIKHVPEWKTSCPDIDIIVDLKDDKNVSAKGASKLEDTFSKTFPHLTRLLGSNPNVNSFGSPVTKAKKMWRTKTIQSKENLLASPNYLSKFDGKYLDLNNCGILTFPLNIIPQITSVQMMYLDSNNLTELPQEIFLILKNLKWLDVRNNDLTYIPASIKGHPSIETLLIQGNNIEKLPLELGLVPNLKNLQTADNPLIFPPKEILDSNCECIINFLRNEWNTENPNEKVELKVDHVKVDKKPSTILCYKSSDKSNLKTSDAVVTSPAKKNSEKGKILKYKPSNRYPKITDSAAKPKDSEFCNCDVATIFVSCKYNFPPPDCRDVCKSADAPVNPFVNNLKALNTTRSRKKHCCKRLRKDFVFSPESLIESNFLQLLGPSPRSKSLRKNINYFTNLKNKPTKLCKIKLMDLSSDKVEYLYKRDAKVATKVAKEKYYDIITNDGVKMTITPMHLRDPKLLIGFLKTLLNLK